MKLIKEQIRLKSHKPNRAVHNKSVDFSDSEWSKCAPTRKMITPNPAQSKDLHILRHDKKEQDPYFIKLLSIVTPAKSPTLKSKKEPLMKKVKKIWAPAPKKLFQYKDKSSAYISAVNNSNSHQIIFLPDLRILSSLGRGVLI